MAASQQSSEPVTPGVILAALGGFLASGVSMGFNPFLAVSVVGIGLTTLALFRAASIRDHVAKGVLRILAVIGLFAALQGVLLALR